MKKSSLRHPFVLTLLLLFLLPTARAQSPAAMDAAEMSLALKRLSVLGTALYVGAHPDDENTALLAYLANGRGARTAYLSLTRGDGGQNLLGPEKGELLGLVRTQELLAARRLDGAEQFFTRAVDFGFSKSPEETLSVWGREPALADVVWVIRRFRPDVIITRFPTTGEGGHGQHTASAVLAREAFEAAGDPARFPEQLDHVRPWRPKRLIWNVFARGGERPAGADKLLTVDVGEYDPLLGKSYTEVAAESRSEHKSQGQGSQGRRGSTPNYFAHLAGEPAAKDIFEGVDLGWGRVAGGEEVGRLLAEAAREFRPSNPQALLPALFRARAALRRLPQDDPLVRAKGNELFRLILACAGLWAEAVAAEPYAAPGAQIPVKVTLVNRSDAPLKFERVSLRDGRSHEVNADLKNNRPVTAEVSVPANAELSQPYWLREAPGRGLFKVGDQQLVGDPSPDSPVPVVVRATAFGGENISFALPVLYRWTDRVRGELYRPVAVVPEVAVRVEGQAFVFPDRAPKRVRVSLKSNTDGASSGVLRLKLPAGWASAPAETPVTLKAAGEEFTADFDVTPPAAAGVATLTAEFESAGRRFTRGHVEIDYPHIPRLVVFPEASARLARTDVRRHGSRVGYVMGSGDEVPEALRQLGYEVVLLSDAELESADLSRFDAVVTGVRAYNTRPALRRQQRRLLEYVERGGTLVAQYNTAERALDGFALGPFPLKITRGERVTVEDAAVRLLAPQHELLNAPNRIVPSDFDGWVQERGLEFPSEWDARYAPLFGMSDPGEPEKRGSTLVARHGRGTYVYTSLAFFRQLPAGVPGAYRLFANFISAGTQGRGR
ncbi:MAG TPA: PIG-L family deacetylase [Pyrinomonadaceae bacterium]|nr:PIG-L family deacetylase [Pyrinomonadaceae bacterium]